MAAEAADGEQVRRILCAFRKPKLRDRLAESLHESGYQISAAGSAVELIDAIAQERPDVVLLDGALGGGDDVELLEAVRESGVLTASVGIVLFASRSEDKQIEARARALGARVFRDRKIRPGALRRLVEQALADPSGAPSEGELLSLFERLRASDPFRALSLSSAATPEEIGLAYREIGAQLKTDALAHTSPEIRGLAKGARKDLKRAYTAIRDPGSSPRAAPAGPETESPSVGTGGRAAGERAAQEGQRMLQQQNYLRGLECFQQAVDLCPKEGEYRAFLGWATYLVEGADPWVLKEAIGHAKEGMKLAPEHFRPPLVLGQLYQFTNRLDLAEKALKRALSLNRESVDIVRELRTLRMRLKRKSAKGLISRLMGRD